jgi:hypothetical protein
VCARVRVCASYQFLGNPAGVKYPYKVVEQIEQWSFIMKVLGLEKNYKEFFKQSGKALCCLELYSGLMLSEVGL